LAVQTDHEHQLTLYLGRHSTVAEFWEKDWKNLLDGVEEVVPAIVSGGYEERVPCEETSS
jgi:hypothetical protein